MSQNDSLIERLEELDRLYGEVERQMNDPAVASDTNRIIAVAKERARLSKLVVPYRHYKELCRERDDAQVILDEAADAELKSLAETEVQEVGSRAAQALEDLTALLVMSDSDDIASVMLEIRAGTGGQEAALFAGDLLDMYRRYAESRRWKFEILSASPTEMGGFREVVVGVTGQDVWSRLGYEGGGHRVQRVPKTESQGRIHTSAATVAVLPEPAEIDVEIDWEKDVKEIKSHASGPGGQNVNKVESAIRLEHVETGIVVSMRDERSQHKNRTKARRVLSARIYEHLRSRQVAAEADARKTMIGSGDRSQRIRTYNFPQNRCTDHRLKSGGGGANFNLDRIIAGQMDELIDALTADDRARRLANL